MQFFVIFVDLGHLYPYFAEKMRGWIKIGKIKYREDIIDDLENTLKAFIGLFNGEKLGKRIIRAGQ